MQRPLLIWEQEEPQTLLFPALFLFLFSSRVTRSLARQADARSVRAESPRLLSCAAHVPQVQLWNWPDHHTPHTRLLSLFISCDSTLSPLPSCPLALFHLPLFLMPRHSASEEKEEKGEMNLGHKRPCISSRHSCRNTFKINKRKRKFICGPRALLLPSVSRPGGGTDRQTKWRTLPEQVSQSIKAVFVQPPGPCILLGSGWGAHTLVSSAGSPPDEDGHSAFRFFTLWRSAGV